MPSVRGDLLNDRACVATDPSPVCPTGLDEIDDPVVEVQVSQLRWWWYGRWALNDDGQNLWRCQFVAPWRIKA